MFKFFIIIFEYANYKNSQIFCYCANNLYIYINICVWIYPAKIFKLFVQ